ncbi:hypothetical protein Bca52824_052104 [Brassica carinata]|uniref:Uncharacterized protein n=1 Tax=Brassica carinata TaxID=52824 RepID=A0A8X7R981_BRACI|nr:hypothetical protein Bca52824_052104 [Brassica carinata]
MGSGELMEVDLLLLDAKVGNVARDQWKSMSYVVFQVRSLYAKGCNKTTVSLYGGFSLGGILGSHLSYGLSFHFSRKGNTNVDYKSEVP